MKTKYVLRSRFSNNVAIVYAEKCVLEFDVWKFYIGEKVVCECNRNTITSIEAIRSTEEGGAE